MAVLSLCSSSLQNKDHCPVTRLQHGGSQATRCMCEMKTKQRKKGKTNAMVSKRGMGERFNMQTINAHKVIVFVFLD
jgi:hypothetical protein